MGQKSQNILVFVPTGWSPMSHNITKGKCIGLYEVTSNMGSLVCMGEESSQDDHKPWPDTGTTFSSAVFPTADLIQCRAIAEEKGPFKLNKHTPLISSQCLIKSFS